MPLLRREREVRGDSLAFMENPEVRKRRKNGICCISYSIIAGSRGYVVVILTRSFSIVRKREVRQEQKVVC